MTPKGGSTVAVEQKAVEQVACPSEHKEDVSQDSCHPETMRTFESAVSHGLYAKDVGGLEGKHDNVRRHWEDQLTRYALHDFVGRLVERKRSALSRVRVVDLGAGSGEGYEILKGLRKAETGLAEREIDVLPAEMVGCYKGLDLSSAMVRLGNQTYAHDPKAHFDIADLAHGLSIVQEEEPFDIYFSSFGSLSHLTAGEMQRLIGDVCEHAPDSFIFVADLLGRYSFEWQCYWDDTGEDDGNLRQYSMSWLYPPDMMDHIEVERFPVRYWGGQEFDDFMTETIEDKGAHIKRKRIWDRSILVGRHMNTGEFNPHAQPLRLAVNSLFQFNRRTDLNSLIFDYVPHDSFPVLNAFFEKMQVAWNSLIYAGIEALEHENDKEWLTSSPSDCYPALVDEAVRTMRNVVANSQSFRTGDARANTIEPQLGYLLRNLEVDLGEGLGAGHGLLAIYEIEKRMNDTVAELHIADRNE
jgi:hypothetical protein